MQLFFIRHGQSTNNLLYEENTGEQNRSEDPPLTEKGLRQAEKLAEYLRSGRSGCPGDDPGGGGFGLTHLYTSLMIRAVSTAVCIARALNLPLVAWPEVHEGGGIYMEDPDTGEPVGLDGKPRAYFERHYPELILPDWLDEKGWWNRPFETRLERRRRAEAFLTELFKRHADESHRVGVVSHGGFYNHCLAVLLGLQDGLARELAGLPLVQDLDQLSAWQQEGLWFSLNNTAISCFNFLPGEVKIVYLNRVDFIPPDLIT